MAHFTVERGEGRGWQRTGQLVCEQRACVVPVQCPYRQTPSCRRALPCVSLVGGRCARESSAGGVGRLPEDPWCGPHCCAEHFAGRARGGCGNECARTKERRTGCDKADVFGSQQTRSKQLCRGRHELVIRPDPTKFQKLQQPSAAQYCVGELAGVRQQGSSIHELDEITGLGLTNKVSKANK